jgi:ABC-2 type transport system permease protein
MSGLMPIFWKEFTDHLYSKRFIVLFIITYIAGIVAIYIASQNIRGSIMDNPTQLVFLRLFILSGENMPFTFPFFLSLFIPILGIALGFDAINSERNSGNLSRILSQPVYRDSVINGKFLAGLMILSILIISIVLVVGGLGLRMIGVPPSSEEVLRLFAFIFVSILYGAFWMALAILFSVVLNRGATSAIASIAIWFFLFFFLGMIAHAIANAAVPLTDQATIAQVTQNDLVYRSISHISPSNLYGEITQALLLPEMGSASQTLMMLSIYTAGMTPGSLPLGQSLLIVWPQIIALIALSAICFTISYIRFQREEIRST